VSAGDEGEFRYSNDGSPPVQVRTRVQAVWTPTESFLQKQMVQKRCQTLS